MKPYLNSTQIEEIVDANLYKYLGSPYKARCFSSGYENNPNLPALSLPGGDIGELAILLSASITYGFELDMEKTVDTLFELISGKKNSTFLSLKEHDPNSCHYLYQLFEKSADFGLDLECKKQLMAYTKVLGLSKGFKLSERENIENACIVIEAEEGLFPTYLLDSDEGRLNAKLLIFHKTYIDRRHRELSKLLLSNGAIKLYSGLDEDYLYQVLSEMSEFHLYETIKKRDSSLPIFFVTVSPERKISIKL